MAIPEYFHETVRVNDAGNHLNQSSSNGVDLYLGIHRRKLVVLKCECRRRPGGVGYIVDILNGKECVTIDELNQKSNLSSSAVAAATLNLELLNVIVSMPGKMYRLT